MQTNYKGRETGMIRRRRTRRRRRRRRREEHTLTSNVKLEDEQ